MSHHAAEAARDCSKQNKRSGVRQVFWPCCSNPALQLHERAATPAQSAPFSPGTARSLAAFYHVELLQPKGDEIPPELFLRLLQTAAASRRRPWKV